MNKMSEFFLHQMTTFVLSTFCGNDLVSIKALFTLTDSIHSYNINDNNNNILSFLWKDIHSDYKGSRCEKRGK